MSETSHIRLARGTRWTGRIIASLESIFFLILFISIVMHPYMAGLNRPERVIFILSGFFGLAGSILSWRDEILACLLLIISSIGLAITLSYEENDLFLWLFIGLPYLISAILLFSSRWLLKGHGKSTGKNEA